MTRQKKIREGIARIGVGGINPLENARPNEYGYKVADQILSYLHSQGVVIKVDGELPQSKDFHWYDDWGGECGRSGFELALKEIKEAGYVAVEPLIEEG